MKKLFLGFVALVAAALCTVPASALAPAPFSTFGLRVDVGTKTASATAGAATLNKLSGVITSEALTTAAGAVYTLTITDASITATDIVFANVANGTNSAGSPTITTAQPANGSLVIKVQNIHASAAFNGTLKIHFVSFKN